MTLTPKFIKAAKCCLEEGSIYKTDVFAFSAMGAVEFLNMLNSMMTTTEKLTFLSEYVFTYSDKQCDELCEYMTGKHNVLESWAKEAAQKILDSDDVQQSLAEEQAQYDAQMRINYSRDVMEDCDSVMGKVA